MLKHYMNNWIPTKLSATSLIYSAATAGDTAAAGTRTAAQMGATSSTISNSISHNNPTAMNKDNINRAKITVDLLPWNLRMRSQKEIRTEGLFASLNDCLYRSMYRWDWSGSHGLLWVLTRFFYSLQILTCCSVGF